MGLPRIVENDNLLATYNTTKAHEFILHEVPVCFSYDGDYSFYQKKSHWGPKKFDPGEIVPAVEYSIQDGKLNGPWLLYNRRGEIVESGRYKNGKRTGTWLYRIEKENEIGYGKTSSLVHVNF